MVTSMSAFTRGASKSTFDLTRTHPSLVRTFVTWRQPIAITEVIERRTDIRFIYDCAARRRVRRNCKNDGLEESHGQETQAKIFA